MIHWGFENKKGGKDKRITKRWAKKRKKRAYEKEKGSVWKKKLVQTREIELKNIWVWRKKKDEKKQKKKKKSERKAIK